MASEQEVRESVQRAFEEWRGLKAEGVSWETRNDSFVDAWAKVAWLADSQRNAMGRELCKLQARVGRQRRANRENLTELEAVRLELSDSKEYSECLEAGIKSLARRLDSLIEVSENFLDYEYPSGTGDPAARMRSHLLDAAVEGD